MASIDFNTATREEFTNSLLHKPIPNNATDDWKRQATDLQDVFRPLAFHTAMVDTGNLAQPYMTPALSKNKIYFMWDFVGRTLAMLYAVPITASGRTSSKAYNDVKGRSVMAGELLLDTKPGMLDMMVEAAYPGAAGDRPDIGDDLKAAAGEL